MWRQLQRVNQIAIRQMQVLTSSNLKALPGARRREPQGLVGQQKKRNPTHDQAWGVPAPCLALPCLRHGMRAQLR